MQRFVQRLTVVFAALCAILAYVPAAATMVESFNFDEMVQRADRIFTGKVTAVENGVTAEGAPYVAYTFAVSEDLKGNVGSTITIRQFGFGASQPRGDNLVQAFKVPSMPAYKKGEEVLLLATAESVIGLSAPIGLFQGAFRLNRNADGNMLARNGSDNVNLFKDMTGVPAVLQAHRRGPVELAALVEHINSVRNQQGGR